MLKAIIFDLDNTLIDFMEMKKRSCESAINAMIDSGLTIPKEKALKILFRLYDLYGIEDKTIFQKFLKKILGRVDWKILASGIVAYRRIKAGYLHPYPRVIPTLIQLKEQGMRLAIVSDAPRMRAYTRLAATQLLDFFDVIVTLGDTKKLKPHKQPFLIALHKLNVQPQECLMLGDNPTRDIKGAQKLGMKTCLAKYGSLWKSTFKADYEIKQFDELLRIL